MAGFSDPRGAPTALEQNVMGEYIGGDYGLPGHPWSTQLSPEEEQVFQQHVQGGFFGRIPSQEVLNPNADYDYRGFFHGIITGDPRAQGVINPKDKELHYPDIWKTPLHRSFSNESQYANPETAPRWNNKDQLIDPKTGKVVFDEKEFIKEVKRARHK